MFKFKSRQNMHKFNCESVAKTETRTHAYEKWHDRKSPIRKPKSFVCELRNETQKKKKHIHTQFNT